MLKKIDDMNFYELLEIPPTATMQDVQKAYDRIRKIYDPNSIALYSLFSAEETAHIRQRIEEAYRTLVHEGNRRAYDKMLRERHEIPEPEPPAPRFRPVSGQTPARTEITGPLTDAVRTKPEASDGTPHQFRDAQSGAVGEFSGAAIRLLRERAGLTTRAVADITKIGERYLQYIENEDFSKLPARIYLRGFLIQYAKVLGVDAERFAGGYLRRYETAMGRQK